MGYTTDAIKGISWLGIFRVLFRCLTFIKLIVLARLLTPSQFGQVDIAIIILALVEIFTETGINVILIQEKEDIDEFINTAWVVSIIRGFLLAFIILISAPTIAVFFDSPESRDFLTLISIVPFIRGFINPSVAKFLKELDYKKQFYYRLSIALVDTFAALLFVILFKNPSGIIFGLILGALWEVLLTFRYAMPLPQFNFDKKKFIKVVSKGKWLTLSGIFDYLYLNLDNIFVGKMLGTGSLGLYMRAYSISLLPITEISDVFNQSTFPIYVRIAGSKMRLKKAYVKTLLTVSLLVLPVGVIFFIFPTELITIILGDKWIEIKNVLRVLIVYGVIRAMLRTTIGLFYSMERQEIITRITAVSLMGMVFTLAPFVYKWGVIGAGLSAIVGTILSMPVVIYYTVKLFNTAQK